ncbi:MAG: alpha/beta hydrolase family protein [Acidobacteriota bacterium]
MRKGWCGSLGAVAWIGILLTFAAPSGDWAQEAVPTLAPPPSVAGIWEGTLEAGGQHLRIVFHISQAPKGGLSATMDSPDQGATGIPVSDVTFEKGRLHLSVEEVNGSYFAELGKDGTLQGTWSQNGAILPLNLRRVESAPLLARPQEPKPPFPYAVREVTYAGGSPGVTLAGTLTLPEGKGPFPAVLLLAGSGPLDRDEALFGHKPFLVLADFLTRQGVAVLRFDKRGVGQSTGDRAQATDDDYTKDALAGLAFLRSQKEVNPKAVGLIGHSEGAIEAVKAAGRSTDVAFIVLLGGPGLPGARILEDQIAAMDKAAGATPEQVAQAVAVEKQILSAVQKQPDDAKASAEIRTILRKEQPELKGQALDRQVQMATSPWFRQFIAYDPRPDIEKVKCPVLALGGEEDLQVPAMENLLAIRGALQKGGNQRYTVKMLPGLNHLFQEASTGLPAEYGRIAQTFSPDALKLIGSWILQQTQK